jgi:Protein of unknown function (DUF3999)
MKRSFLLLVAFSLAITLYGQRQDYQYKRKIQAVENSGWYGIHLPADIFEHVTEDFSDLRIMKISGSDTTEIPYLLKVREAISTTKTINFKEVNKSKRDGKTYVTFQVPDGRTVNHAVFNFEEDNYDASVTIEGSQDQKQWFTITEKQRVVSLQKAGIEFASRDISFPPTNYQFLRATIQGTPVTFVSASFEEAVVKNGVVHAVDLKWKTTEKKSDKQTIIDLTFTNVEPADQLSIVVDQATDYYRTYSMEVLTDSFKTEKGYRRNYTTLQSGYLTSIRKNDLVFPLTKTKQLRLTIFNADNAPLKIKTITASRPAIAIVGDFSGSNDYHLFYGNTALAAPSYDLVHFQDKVPDLLVLLSLGKEIPIDDNKATPQTPLFENPVWIWSIIGLMMLVLGFFTLRMIRSK